MRHQTCVILAVTLVMVWGCAARTTGGSSTMAQRSVPESPVPHAAEAVKPPPAMTNDDVIELSKTGLDEQRIISRVQQTSRVDFDLGSSGLQRLKAARVGKAVIAVMLDRSAGPQAHAVAPASFSASGKTWIPRDGQLVEMEGAAGYVEASIGQAFKQAFLFSFTNKMAIIARGSNARLRLTEDPRVIYTRHVPSEVGVVRFTVQSDRERRYVWVVSRVGSTMGEFYPPEDVVKFDDESLSDGVHKLTLKSPLTAGEYALVAPGGNTGYLVYDFSVAGN